MTRSTARTRLVSALLGAALALAGAVTLGASPAAASDSSMFGQVNASRAAKGLAAYSWNSHLASVAAGQAHRMAKKGDLYHNPNLSAEVGSFRWVGENVGFGPNSDVVQSAFMKSPAHRANILDDDYTQIGIASERDDKGRIWIAQVFREPIGGGSAEVSKPKKKKSSSSGTPTRSKPKTRTTTQRGDASTPDPTPQATPSTPSPRPAVAKPADRPARRTTPAPAPAPTLAERVSYAQDQAPTASDPLADALAFAAAMNAVAG